MPRVRIRAHETLSMPSDYMGRSESSTETERRIITVAVIVVVHLILIVWGLSLR